MIMLKVLLLLLCAGYALLAATVYFSQQSMVFNPSRVLEATPADMGLPFTDVELITTQGTHLNAWWLPHPQARATLLFCHGNGGNISHREESFRIFHSLNLNVFIFDYSGYGQSMGKPSEKAVHADTRAAWDWLVQEMDIPADEIIVFGRSLGGGAAAGLVHTLQGEGVRPRGLIMESTFSSLPDVGTTIYPWLPVRLLAKNRFEASRSLARADIPALFIHSREDDVIPYAIGRKLFENYQGPKDFLHIEGRHNRGFAETGQPYINGLARFLNRLDRS
jgi:uncharacterized protein